MQLFASLIVAVYCIQHATSHGKEEPHPHLTKETMNALVPHPKSVPQKGIQSIATCYQGYTLMSDGTCVKDVVEEPIPAVGDITVPYITRCPPGFAATNGGCAQTKETPLAYFCPVGFEDDGSSCSQTIPGEVVTSCTEGELINGLCVLTERVPHLVTPKCPQGSQVERDGNCWKIVETFDCTPGTGKEIHGRVIAAPRNPIPLGKKILVSKGKEGGKLRSLHPVIENKAHETLPYGPHETLPYGPPSKHSVHGKLVQGKEHLTPTAPILIAPTACPTKELVSVSPPHPTKIAPLSQLCAKKVFVDSIAVVSCPEGFEDFSDACIKETTVPPVSLCLSNGSTQGNCPPTIRKVPKIVRCPSGQPPVSDKCLVIATVPAENVCAEGFRNTGNGCTARVKSGGLECRPGLALVENKCIGKSIRPSVAVDMKAPLGCDNKY